MEAIGRLAGGVAHDFNNLLTVIVGYSEFVHAALPPDSAMAKDVAEILRAASSAASLTRQLLIFSRKDVVHPAVIGLTDVVERIERMLRRIDLLLTDIVMPGLSGRELAARLLESRVDLKVLYTSGYTDEVVALRDIQVNGPDFMRKPYSPESLARKVRESLARKVRALLTEG